MMMKKILGIRVNLNTQGAGVSISKSLKKNSYPIKELAKDYWFRKGKTMVGMRGLLVMDPDGYLLMFNQDLGVKPIKFG